MSKKGRENLEKNSNKTQRTTIRYRDVDVRHFVNFYVSEEKHFELYKEPLLIGLRKFCNENPDKPYDSKELSEVINKIMEEEITTLIDYMVSEKCLNVENVNGEDVFIPTKKMKELLKENDVL